MNKEQEPEPQLFDDFDLEGFMVNLYYKGKWLGAFDIRDYIQDVYEYVGYYHKPVPLKEFIDI